MVVTTVFLVRHGKSQGNLQRRFQGHYENKLGEIGIEQVQYLRDSLKKQRFDAVYVSPIGRAMQTAELLLRGRDLKIIPDEGLTERKFGELEGMALSEAEIMHPGISDFYFGVKDDVPIKGVESFEKLGSRAISTLQRIISANEGKVILIISHFYWIKGLICEIMGSRYDELTKFTIPPSSVTVLEAKKVKGGQRYNFIRIGDVSHLTDIDI